MRIELPDGPLSSSTARKAVRTACDGIAVDADDVLLCAAELVTNALLHGGPPIELEIDVTDDVVRVAIHDSRPGLVEKHQPVTADTSAGRGLQIVESLSARWGALHYEGGKAVWFEFDVAGPRDSDAR